MRAAISTRLRYEVLRRCNFACYYCGLPATHGVKQLHIDHVIPVSLGGTNDPWNLVAACWDCNSGKTNGVPDEALVRQVRDDFCAHSEAIGQNVLACQHCGIPLNVDDWEDTSCPQCNTCNEMVCNAYDAGLRAAGGESHPVVQG